MLLIIQYMYNIVYIYYMYINGMYLFKTKITNTQFIYFQNVQKYIKICKKHINSNKFCYTFMVFK